MTEAKSPQIFPYVLVNSFDIYTIYNFFKNNPPKDIGLRTALTGLLASPIAQGGTLAAWLRLEGLIK